uniref:Cadherin domain-containing protein n=1 Tax=Oryzias latipes TaxID=8090 RepID=A0A3P9KZU3_ORYLA
MLAFFSWSYKGNRFSVEEAHDADIGQNAVQRYTLQKNDNFILAVDNNKVELVLENTLDREKQSDMNLLLTAVDGGSPQRSGTVIIHVTVLDANDNAPVFSQDVYKTTLPENSPPETLVITVSATDADEGVNADVTYDFGHMSEDDVNVFSIDSRTGEMKITGVIDFEEKTIFEVRVEAKDGLGLTAYAKVLIDVTDVNDNPPVIYLKSLSSSIPENAPPGTEVGIINVQDRDSDKNGQVRCSIQANAPFKFCIPKSSPDSRNMFVCKVPYNRMFRCLIHQCENRRRVIIFLIRHFPPGRVSVCAQCLERKGWRE